MKKVGKHFYAHISALKEFTESEQSHIVLVQALTPESAGKFNVVKLSSRSLTISLLNYDRFIEEPFPVLLEAWTVSLAPHKVKYTDYRGRDNPPVLHRKELLLPRKHPARARAAILTAKLEQAGLLTNTAGIGTKRAWEKRLRDAGVQVLHNRLVPITNQGDRT